MIDTRTALEEISRMGYAVSTIAKNIGCDQSTLSKWMRGTSKYLSEKKQEELIDELRRMKEFWVNLDI